MSASESRHAVLGLGKVSPETLQRIILPFTGARRPEVRVGPGQGLDAAVVELGDGRVMVAATDPLWASPTLGMERSGWLAAHQVASDLVTTGFAPQYALIDLHLPPAMADADLEAYWSAMHRAWRQLGVSVIGGHTGRYPGCDYTIVGAGTLLAFGPGDAYLSPAMARPGDRIVLTKGAAVEATGALAALFPRTVADRLGSQWQPRCEAFLEKASVVPEARAAVAAGIRDDGVTSLHDATEGGVVGALAELAAACNHGIDADLTRVPVAEETRRICNLFELDPLRITSQGTLLLTVRPHRVGAVQAAMESIGVPSVEIGRIVPAGEGRFVRTAGGREPLVVPASDPYWDAYQQACEAGWS